MKQMIYIADDEQDVLDVVGSFLVNAGYDIRTFTTGDDLCSAFDEAPCDLVILDIMMPGSDGLAICRRLRSVSDVPVIFLTGRSEEADHMRGFVLGGDDYVTKPFSPTLLVARVNALMRRAGQAASRNQAQRFGDLLFSESEHKVFCIQNDLGMSLTEFALFSCLMEHPGEAVSRTVLLDRVWGIDASQISTRVADETIRRIRQKLKRAGSQVKISSIWGYGYCLEAPDAASGT